MHAFLSILMAGLLFIQGVTGWCWQRQRQCVQCDECAARAPGLAQCCAHDGAKEQQPEQPGRPCEHKVLCRGCCTYLLPEKTQIDAADWGHLLCFAAIPAAEEFFPPSSFWAFACGPVELKPPLRLHLYHQVLLI